MSTSSPSPPATRNSSYSTSSLGGQSSFSSSLTSSAALKKRRQRSSSSRPRPTMQRVAPSGSGGTNHHSHQVEECRVYCKSSNNNDDVQQVLCFMVPYTGNYKQLRTPNIDFIKEAFCELSNFQNGHRSTIPAVPTAEPVNQTQTGDGEGAAAAGGVGSQGQGALLLLQPEDIIEVRLLPSRLNGKGGYHKDDFVASVTVHPDRHRRPFTSTAIPSSSSSSSSSTTPPRHIGGQQQRRGVTARGVHTWAQHFATTTLRGVKTE